MNKLFSKIAALSVGLAMAIGVGVAVGSKGVREARATDVTISATDIVGISGSAGDQTGTASGFTFHVENGLVNGHLRVYKGKYLEITAPANYDLKQIVFTCTASGTAQYGPGCFELTSGGGTYTPTTGTTGTWAGTSESVKLTASSNQVRITTFAITYEPQSTTDPKITLSKSSLFFINGSEAQAMTATPNSAFTVTPTLSVASTPSYVNVAFDGLNISVSPKAVGTEEVTINASGGGKNASATFSVRVVDAHGYVSDDPFTVAEAKAQIDAGIPGSDKVYVSGIISQIDVPSSFTGQICYWISDDGTTDGQFEIYWGKNIGNVNFDSLSDIELGASVVNYGAIKKYNTTYEFDSGSYLFSYTAPVKTLTSISLSGTYKTSFEVGDAFSHEGLVVTAHYNIGSDADVTSSATVSTPDMSTTGEKTVTVSYTEGKTESVEYKITVTAVAPKYTVTYTHGENGSGVYEHENNPAGSYTLLAFDALEGVSADEGYRFKSYTVGGVEKNPGESIEISGATAITVNFEEQPDETTVTTNIAEYATAHSWGSSSSAGQKSITMDSNITASCNDGGNSGKYYSDGWRIYQTESGKITITAANNATLLSVTFTFTVSNTGKLSYNDSALTSGVAVSVSGTSAEFVVGNTGSATNGQVRITEISVTYSGSAPTPVTSYTVTYDANGGVGTLVDPDSPYESGATVTVLNNTFARADYTFVEWNTAADGSGQSYAGGATFNASANVVLYAQWAEESGDKVLSWSRSGSTDTYTSGYTLTAAAEGKQGYYQDGSGEVRSISLSRTSSPIVSSAPVAITITATLGGGTVKDLDNPVYACYVDASGNDVANSAVVLTNSITDTNGSEFTASLSASLATSAYGVKVYHVKESGYNVRYYGFVVELSDTPTYTITYNANGGSGTMSPTVGESPVVADCTFTKDGYAFERWNTQADGEGINYAVEASVSEDITLYAIWQEQIAPVGADVEMTGVTAASAATVNGHPAIKCGASGTAGSMTLTLKKANITKIKVYIAGWNNDTYKTLDVSINNGATISANSIELVQDSGVSGSGSSFTLEEAETTYKFEFTISADAPANTVITLTAPNASKNRFVVWGATNLFAETFASEFMSNLTCDSTGESEPTYKQDYSWSVLESVYNGLDAEEQGRLHDAEANKGGTQIEQAMARYDYIQGKYNPDGTSVSYKNFIGRSITPIPNGRTINSAFAANNNTSIIIIVIAAASALAFTTLLVFKKKKQR